MLNSDDTHLPMTLTRVTIGALPPGPYNWGPWVGQSHLPSQALPELQLDRLGR